MKKSYVILIVLFVFAEFLRVAFYNAGLKYDILICAVYVAACLIYGLVVNRNFRDLKLRVYNYVLCGFIIIALVFALIMRQTVKESNMLTQISYQLPEFLCLFFIILFESLAQLHTVPTFYEREELFKSSDICAGLTDKKYKILLKSDNGTKLSKENIISAVNSEQILSDGMALLKCVDVPGGHFYWVEDRVELLKLNEKLSDTGDYLSEEHAVLHEAAMIEEAHKRTTEQNRLFDSISQSLQPQLNSIEEILNGLPDDEAGFRREMKRAGVLGAYVKRYSNLLLLSAAESRADSSELYLCINESFSYLRLLGAFCCADIQQGIELPVSCELLMYELFEAVVEAVPFLPEIFVTLKQDDGILRYYIEASNDMIALDKSFYEKAETAGFSLVTEISDGCFFAVMRQDAEGML